MTGLRERPDNDSFSDWDGYGMEPGYGEDRMRWAFTPGGRIAERKRHRDDDPETWAEDRRQLREPRSDTW